MEFGDMEDTGDLGKSNFSGHRRPTLAVIYSRAKRPQVAGEVCGIKEIGCTLPCFCLLI